MPQSLSAVYQ